MLVKNYIPSKKIILIVLTSALAFMHKANAQEVRVIDNKGTMHTVTSNKVITTTTTPAQEPSGLPGDIWIDEGVKPNQVYAYDDKQTESILDDKWEPIGIRPSTTQTISDAEKAKTIKYLVNVEDNNGKITTKYAEMPFFKPVAMGKVNADGTTSTGSITHIRGATVSKVTGEPQGVYQITFTNALDDSNYIIQLTVKSLGGTGNDSPNISYDNQQTTGFKVIVGDSDNGASAIAKKDIEFMFSVFDF